MSPAFGFLANSMIAFIIVSFLIYEYLDSEDGSTAVKKIEINDGEFTNPDSKALFLVSDSFKNANSKFINAGKFSNDIDNEFVATGRIVALDNDYYTVSNKLKLISSMCPHIVNKSEIELIQANLLLKLSNSGKRIFLM